tara:strand:+ start:2351 stop:3142 length:792 start_codon:yes stop_codon:yes gene_type:complete
MTEKLTYDPTPADAPEFTEEEQQALEVAEKLGQEENELILGKFENADELAKAYSELEKKLGTTEAEDKAEVAEPSEETEPEVEESPAISLINEASQEYTDNDGQISEETMAKFNEMDSKDLVAAYMDIQKNAPAKDDQPTRDLTDSEVSTIQQSVGGERTYNQMLSWASNNLDPKLIEGFDNVVQSGNPQAIQIAVAGIKAQYDEANGYEGRMLSGKSAQTSGDVFRSQAELVKALGDPRYETDPAYQQDIYDKLQRSSNVQF